MGLKDRCKDLSKISNASKLVFGWSESSTHKSNAVTTADLRIDIHKNISNPGWAVAKIQVNKDAKDKGAREFLKRNNKGAHKTTHKNLAEISFCQTDFDEALVKQQIADAWRNEQADDVSSEGEASGSKSKKKSKDSKVEASGSKSKKKSTGSDGEASGSKGKKKSK